VAFNELQQVRINRMNKLFTNINAAAGAPSERHKTEWGYCSSAFSRVK